VTTEEFISLLGRLTAGMILAAAADLDLVSNTVSGELAWWHATVEVDRLVRLHHAGRRASLAASQAVAAVTASARAGGLDLKDHRVVAVARAAADAARALTAGAAAGDDLLVRCRHLLAA
jgi:hypothetical protein